MFNRGDLYKKKFESNYSVLRRFILANPAVKSKDLIEKLKDLESFESFSFMKDPIVNYRTSSNEANYRWAGAANQISRNCPECSKILYHSFYYELDCVSKCPFHKIDILEKCPECNSAWPSLPQIKDRDCQTCGVKISFKILASRKAFLDFQSYEELYSIIKVCNSFLKIPDAVLHSGYALSRIQKLNYKNRFEISKRSVAKQSYWFIPMAASIYESKRNILFKAGLRFEKIRTFNAQCIEIDPNKNSRNYLFSTYNEDEIAISEKSRIIREFESNLFNGIVYEPSFSLKNAVEIGDFRLFENSDCFLLAHAIWIDLLKQRPNHFNEFVKIKSYSLFNSIGGIQPPLIPTYKRYATFNIFDVENYKKHGSKMLFKEKILYIPHYLSSVIYEVDVRILFYNILFFLELCQKKLNDINLDIYRLFPKHVQLFSPWNAIVVPIGVFIRNGDSVSITIPDKYINYIPNIEQRCDHNREDLKQLKKVYLGPLLF